MGASLPRPPSPSFNRWGVRDHHSNHTMQVRHHPIDVRVCDDPRVMEVVGSVRMQDEAVDDEHIAGPWPRSGCTRPATGRQTQFRDFSDR
jgi:hypothetical protein